MSACRGMLVLTAYDLDTLSVARRAHAAPRRGAATVVLREGGARGMWVSINRSHVRGLPSSRTQSTRRR